MYDSVEIMYDSAGEYFRMFENEECNGMLQSEAER